jgi:hypothetical protein
MLIVNDHTGAIGATGLKIQQDSTAPAMHINAGGNDVMKVDSNSRISLSNNGGGSNTTFGYLALNSATANVANNIAIGHETLKAMDGTETGNVALGYQAMLSVDENINSGGGTNSANYNVAVGYQALTGGQFSDGNNSDNKDFTGNIAIGAFALNSTGTNAVTGAVAIGQSSLTAMTSGANNTAVGYISGASVSTGSGNTFIGDRAGDATDDGNSNTAVGYLSLSANCANYNVAVGAESLKVATGSYNTAVGFESQLAITDSERNTSLGYQSLKTASTGDSNNTAIGYASLQISTTEGNTSVGSSSSQFIDTGENNTALGYGAMTSSGSGNDASLNVAVGYLAFNGATDGDQNTIIGASANPSAGTGSNQTVIGYNATGVANNSVTLGNASVTAVYMSQDSGAVVHSAGIQFPASQVANGGANVLDDYEEGTWTPLPADASSGGNTASAGTATGHYTKIGRIVHCEFTLVNINTTGMTSGNDFFIQGLPFAVATHAGHAHGSVALENVNFTGEYVTISPAGGTSAIRLAEVPDNSNIDIVMVSEINDDSADIYGHFTYMA